ncbi:unnamed protein product [Ectocarpus sp. CCAP 1310/34]|nr:unnamed protein product [Ectocarpus sp. CCAP 1310/34]
MAAVGYTTSSITVVSMPDQDPQRDNSTPAPIPSTEPPASRTGDDDTNTNSCAELDSGGHTDDDTSTNTNATATATATAKAKANATAKARANAKANAEGKAKANAMARRRRFPSFDEIEKLPGQAINSCDKLRSGRTRMEGVLLITGDIVCREERLLEITEELIILSQTPVLYLEGVRIHFKENAKLRFGVSTMRVEKLEGISGAIFTVEPQGYVGLYAHGQGPVPHDGSEEDTNSLVHVQTGGEFFFDCHARYTASGMSAVVIPYPENPSWMRLHVLSWLRTRRQLEQQHHEQQHQEQQGEQQQGRRGAGTTPPSTTAGEFSFWPGSGCLVGEELRFPSTMTSLDEKHVMTMGFDGSLLHTGPQRYRFFRDEMVQAVENRPSGTLSTQNILSGLNPDYDGGEPRADLKVLAAADPAQAMRSFRGRRKRFELSKVLEGEEREATEPTADVVAEMERTLEEFLRERKNKSDVNMEDDDEEEKVPPHQPESTAEARRRSRSSKGRRATDSDGEGRSSGTGVSSSNDDRSEATAVVAKNVPSSPPQRYFGDVIVLQVTKAGDVAAELYDAHTATLEILAYLSAMLPPPSVEVVTIGGQIVMEKGNPFRRQTEKLDPSGERGNWLEKQLNKANPLSTVGRIIRRHRLRRERNDSASSNGADEIVSLAYSLHVVEKGFEVELESVFV